MCGDDSFIASKASILKRGKFLAVESELCYQLVSQTSRFGQAIFCGTDESDFNRVVE